MTLNTKTRRYILLTILLVFSLTTLSCGLLGGGDKEEESKATQPPAAEVTKAPAKEATPAAEQPTKTPAGEKTKPPAGPSGETGLFANPEETLDSYRMSTKMTLKEGEGILGKEMATEIEWVRDPEARHTAMYGSSGDMMMEMITIGDDTWSSMDGENWMHVKKTETGEEAPFSPEDLQASLEDILEDMEGGLKKAGKDTVDGVRCQEYDVDADFSLPFPTPENASEQMLQFMPQEIEGHVKGKICVADERGLPEVIIRSQTTQKITLKYASDKEETMVYDETRELYDINKPITIEPPVENVQEMPTPPEMPTLPPSSEQPTQPGESVAYADLNELDSYRLGWTMTMKTGDTKVASSYQVEWTKDPLATHLTVNMGEGMPAIEYILANDTVWMKMGTEWMEASKEELDDTINEVGDAITPDDDMQFVGEETVNGVKCKHYVKEENFQGVTTKHDVWIANQGDLPPVVIRGIFYMESGVIQTMESNVTDINTPITIEPPK